MKKVLFLCFFVGLWAGAHDGRKYSGDSNLLILQSSDHHGAYNRIESFLRATIGVRNEFLARNPQGKVVHLYGGDVVGQSVWTRRDEGRLGIEGVALPLYLRDEALITLGNHDAFDWLGARGSALFLEYSQILDRAFKAAGGKNFAWTVANLQPTTLGASAIESQRELSIGNEKYRFVGLTLANFFQASRYGRRSEPQLFQEVQSPYTAAQRALRQAIQDGVPNVIFFSHDSFIKVKALSAALQEWLKKEGLSDRIKVPVFFAAHDHQHHIDLDGASLVVDSGRSYDFSAVELSASGDAPPRVTQYLEKDQRAFARTSIPTEWEQYLDRVHREMRELGHYYESVIGQTFGVEDVRGDVRHARRKIGTLICDSMQAWAAQVASDQGIPLAFFNSSSYRRKHPIAAGPLTRGVLASLYPINGKVELYRLTGAEVQTLFTSLRRFIHSASPFEDYSPQMNSDLGEDAEGRLVDLLQKAPLDPHATYVLALDHYLNQNAYNIEEWSTILTATKRIADIETHLLLEKELTPRLRPTSCEVESAQTKGEERWDAPLDAVNF